MQNPLGLFITVEASMRNAILPVLEDPESETDGGCRGCLEFG
jgi:hypothetical protein